MVSKVALLTAGGFAPCLSSAIGGLIERYTEIAPEVEIIAYRYGYQGLLSGDSISVGPAARTLLRVTSTKAHWHPRLNPNNRLRGSLCA